jgi:hypothetical protein
LLALGPTLYLGAEPELHAPVAELAHWTRHVLVPVLVNAHRVAVSETQEFGHSVCVEKIVDVYPSTHRQEITAVVGSVRADR